MNIVLLGFMGTGKTAVGRYLSRRLKMKFVDIDFVIEDRSGLSVKDIFQRHGQKHFRVLEKQAIAEASRGDEQIISAGGGAVLDEENMDLLKENGFLVCLRARPEIIRDRVRDSADRPLLEKGDCPRRIEELLRERDRFYRKIPAQIDTSDISIEEAGERVISAYNNKGGDTRG